MQETLNYKLKKPDGTDVVNIEDLNFNADIIDTKLKETVIILNKNSEEVNTHLADMTQQIENIDLSADKIKIADKNNKFNSTEVEGALYECITKAEEAFIGADNGKKNWVDVIGSPLLNTDSFSTLKSKTQTLKNTMGSNLSSKGQSASGTEGLNSLIDKVKSIDTGLKYATGILEEELSRFTIRNLSFRPEHIFLIDVYYDGPGGIKKYYSSSYNVSVGSSKTVYNAFEIYDDGFALVNAMTFSKAGSVWVAFGE